MTFLLSFGARLIESLRAITSPSAIATTLTFSGTPPLFCTWTVMVTFVPTVTLVVGEDAETMATLWGSVTMKVIRIAGLIRVLVSFLAVTVTVYVPIVCPTHVRVLVPETPRLMLLMGLHDSPVDGETVRVKVTVPVNPPTAVAVNVEVPEVGLTGVDWMVVTVVRSAMTVKSGSTAVIVTIVE